MSFSTPAAIWRRLSPQFSVPSISRSIDCLAQTIQRLLFGVEPLHHALQRLLAHDRARQDLL
jgi:hypothetical protein